MRAACQSITGMKLQMKHMKWNADKQVTELKMDVY